MDEHQIRGVTVHYKDGRRETFRGRGACHTVVTPSRAGEITSPAVNYVWIAMAMEGAQDDGRQAKQGNQEGQAAQEKP